VTGPRRSRGSRFRSRRRQGGAYSGHINRVNKVSQAKVNPNPANEWAKKKIPEMKRERGGRCEFKGCGETRLNKLEFVHVEETPISRTGSRGRKEKIADIRAHPEAYRLECKKHHHKDKAAVEHDAEMREKGAREEV
jgi:hypothetical protein